MPWARLSPSFERSMDMRELMTEENLATIGWPIDWAELSSEELTRHCATLLINYESDPYENLLYRLGHVLWLMDGQSESIGYPNADMRRLIVALVDTNIFQKLTTLMVYSMDSTSSTMHFMGETVRKLCSQILLKFMIYVKWDLDSAVFYNLFAERNILCYAFASMEELLSIEECYRDVSASHALLFTLSSFTDHPNNRAVMAATADKILHLTMVLLESETEAHIREMIDGGVLHGFQTVKKYDLNAWSRAADRIVHSDFLPRIVHLIASSEIKGKDTAMNILASVCLSKRNLMSGMLPIANKYYLQHPSELRSSYMKCLATAVAMTTNGSQLSRLIEAEKDIWNIFPSLGTNDDRANTLTEACICAAAAVMHIAGYGNRILEKCPTFLNQLVDCFIRYKSDVNDHDQEERTTFVACAACILQFCEEQKENAESLLKKNFFLHLREAIASYGVLSEDPKINGIIGLLLEIELNLLKMSPTKTTEAMKNARIFYSSYRMRMEETTKEKFQQAYQQRQERFTLETDPIAFLRRARQSHNGVKECLLCGKVDPSVRYCSRCMNVSYCGAQCQKQHWPKHKTDCKPQKR
ncbi:zinc finger MYND domain-containing protein 10-like isoform 2 [Planoprotostelium fungivorum]|uniref:Zinc finger MYND domain-containing protein 10-like isoform 2 n=1 Tax=Planoprotostelium fungivorum TaxID=1890364 RepID=A0A2P6NJD6_9EUKA|nr:zinc finger MYND domain-containing protein 10-like isoform 2 [Planoprotostelium fungivorum]